MKIAFKTLFATILVAYFVIGWGDNTNAQQPSNTVCQTDNAALSQMPAATVRFSREDGTDLDLIVKLAATPMTRAAGFQRVCASVVEKTPILFVFEREQKPSFHMRNVVTPLDIAFIAKSKRVDSIRKMKPYVLGSTRRPLYSSDHKVMTALEVTPGFFEANNIDLTVTVDWHRNQD
jgi:uncharacterized membrane protein (UPF0127 family)